MCPGTSIAALQQRVPGPRLVLLPHNVTLFGDRALKEIINLKIGCWDGPQLSMAGVLKEEDIWT